jgi:hypothetical protein
MRGDSTARRVQEWITPPSFEVQTMSFTRMQVASSDGTVKFAGK